MISTGELRKGVAIELDGELWQILDYHHIKMGRGSAQVRITLRNIKRGQTVERSFQAGTKWPRASMEKRPVQFLYRDGDDFHFMQNDTYDQFVLSSAQLDDAVYLGDDRALGGQERISSTNSSRSTRPLSPPTSFIRAPLMPKLKIRVLAVSTRCRRTTSPTLASARKSVSPFVEHHVAETTHRREGRPGAVKGRDIVRPQSGCRRA